MLAAAVIFGVAISTGAAAGDMTVAANIHGRPDAPTLTPQSPPTGLKLTPGTPLGGPRPTPRSPPYVPKFNKGTKGNKGYIGETEKN
jgi:hypothetical protein